MRGGRYLRKGAAASELLRELGVGGPEAVGDCRQVGLPGVLERGIGVDSALSEVPLATTTTALDRRLREDLDQSVHDQSISPAAANALLGAMTSALGQS